MVGITFPADPKKIKIFKKIENFDIFWSSRVGHVRFNSERSGARVSAVARGWSNGTLVAQENRVSSCDIS